MGSKESNPKMLTKSFRLTVSEASRLQEQMRGLYQPLEVHPLVSLREPDHSEEAEGSVKRRSKGDAQLRKGAHSWFRSGL